MKELKRFRESLRLNQKEMSNEIGVSESYYFKVEKGLRNPSYGFMCKLKDRFPSINIDLIFFRK